MTEGEISFIGETQDFGNADYFGEFFPVGESIYFPALCNF